MNKQTTVNGITVTATTFASYRVGQHVNPYGVLVQNGEGVTEDADAGVYVSYVANGPGVRNVGLGNVKLCEFTDNMSDALDGLDLYGEAQRRLPMYGLSN